MGRYWDEVKDVLKKGADLAGVEIRKDYGIFLQKAKQVIDTAADDISKNTEKIREKFEKNSEKTEGEKSREFEKTLDKARERINIAVNRLKKDSETIISKAREDAGTLAGKAKESAELVKLKTRLYRKQNELKNTLADLGNAALSLYSENKDFYKDADLIKYISKSKNLEKQCRDIQKEIENKK